MTTYTKTTDGKPDRLPIVVIVDFDRAACATAERAMLRRFGSDYAVLTADSAAAGLDLLECLAQRDEAVALIVADLHLPETDGIAFLECAGAIHRHAARALLVTMNTYCTRIPYGALASIQRATALGCIDFWLMKGWDAADELLYPQIQEALTAWTKANRPRYSIFRVVGERWSPQSHALREAIERNSMPSSFYPLDSADGQQLVNTHKIDVSRLPAVILHDGAVLHQPTPVDIAHTIGARTQPSGDLYDLAIVGAGPAGLAAAVYGASEGLRTLVIEPYAIGGQAGASSLIRNYLGFPWGVSGGELGFRALEQALTFGAEVVYMQQACGLELRANERVIALRDACPVRARAVVVASGVDYRRLGVAALERLVGAGVFYGAAGVEASALVGEEVYVVGGANSAGQAAQHLAKFAARVTLLVRGSSLEAGMSEYLISQIRATPNIAVRLRAQVVDGRGDTRLEGLVVEDVATGQREEVAAAAVFVMIGAEPRTEWLGDVVQRDARGFLLTGRDVPLQGWPLARTPLPFETSVPGVFAVGDARHGSVKRVAGAVGEGSVAVGSVHQYLAERPAVSVAEHVGTLHP